LLSRNDRAIPFCDSVVFGIQQPFDDFGVGPNGGSLASVTIRVLVVDDFEPWRQQVCSILGARPELRVVAEAADGLEAVQKAEELKPDLIVLDMGLPSLDGLEVANRIGRVAPGTKIIFVTQNSDKDLVRRALNNGALGYVLKTDAASELLTAVAAVLGGDRCLSRGIKGYDSAETEDT
jgi:DNA-binding NarL/FixJ family response regulator